MRCPLVFARGISSGAIPVRIGEMASKAYLGGEGVWYRMGARPVLLLNEEGITKLLVDDSVTRCSAASSERSPRLQIRAMQLRFAEERATLVSHSHEANMKLFSKANVLHGNW